MIDTTKTRPLFGPPRPLFDTKKRGQLFWAIFWLPKVKKAGPFFLQIGRSLFAQVPIFGPAVLALVGGIRAPGEGVARGEGHPGWAVRAAVLFSVERQGVAAWLRGYC